MMQRMLKRPLHRPTLDQDILEGWVNLDIQEGHLQRCKGC